MGIILFMTVPVGKSVANDSADRSEVPSSKPKERLGASVAGGMLCAAIVYAPFAYGAIPPWAITLLVSWLFLAAVLWALDCALERRRPRFPLTLSVPAGA